MERGRMPVLFCCIWQEMCEGNHEIERSDWMKKALELFYGQYVLQKIHRKNAEDALELYDALTKEEDNGRN